MKILIIASYAESLMNFRGPLLDALMAKGFKVEVAAPDLSRDSAVRRQLENKGICVHNLSLRRTGMNPLVDLVTLLSLWIIMRRSKPDYLLGYTVKPVIYGSFAAWLSGISHRFALITGLGYTFQGSRGDRKFVKHIVQLLYRAALSKTHKVFFQNPDDQALFTEMGILNPNTPTAIVNGSGVDVSGFNASPLPAQPHFLLIARLLGDKGVREYVEAAAIVKKKYPETVFSLVGWIDENPDAIKPQELKQWIAAKTVDFHGRLSDVRPAIEDCSVYVLPSYREGTPRTVLEAMAMGRPIITTDAPGCRETVVNGENGYLVPVKAITELAEAMMRFIEKPALIAQMGSRSRQIAVDKYDVRKVNAFMLNEMGIK